MGMTRRQREKAARQNGKATQVVEPEAEYDPEEEIPTEIPESRSVVQGAHRRAMSLREKHAAKREDLKKIQRDADDENKLMEILRESLSPEALQLFHSKICGNPTLCRIRFQKNDGEKFPPGSVRRRDLRLSGLRMEMKIIAGLDVEEVDRQILVDLAKVDHGFIEIEDLGTADVGGKKYHEVMANSHGTLQNELRAQSLWNAMDIGVIGLTGGLALLAFVDGGMSLGAAAKAGLWCGVGYAGHKTIKHRDELMSKFHDFAAGHGLSKMQARDKAVSMMQSAK